MFHYEKKLQYPVKIGHPNPRLAAVIISQYGGPDGELGASLRYLTQRYSMPYDELKGLLTDIGTSYSFCSFVWISVNAFVFSPIDAKHPLHAQTLQKKLYSAILIYCHVIQ